MNVDLKAHRKVLDEALQEMKGLRSNYGRVQKQLDEMNVTLLRTLKNNCMDNELLNREIRRMQEIDRLKVNHAKDVFYNPDSGSVLPSLDTCHASLSDAGNRMAYAASHALTPQPHLLDNSAKDYGATISARDVVTQNELKGVCERLAHQPSKRQRIIIARSQDPGAGMRHSGVTASHLAGADTDRSVYHGGSTLRPKIGSLDQRALDEMSKTIHFKNDSKMSIQAGVVQRHAGSKPGPFSPILHHNSQAAGAGRPFVAVQGALLTSRPELGRKPSPTSLADNEVATVSHLNQQSHSNDFSQDLPALAPAPGFRTLADDGLFVSLQTPAIPNAIERIKQRQTEKKQEKIRRQKKLEEQMEKSKAEILERHDIKSMV